ncbi:ras association domain-containing protein 8 isoform X2 [Trichogramma pretiosum]|uniref:Ras-associating domain-containing protein n=1 Tax=Trichogramma kaykai TaxID=54128 RepID=A0ABD2VT89_9HYME|nr:ras association domain-containing protein 8 isoform X2 [Trichogramma pretiosum]
MELKVWVEGIQRIVCGVTETTTCQDVVYALAHATAQTGKFTLIEKWRTNERLLAPYENPLKILMKWGEYAPEVQLVLRKSTPDGNKSNVPTNSRGMHANRPNGMQNPLADHCLSTNFHDNVKGSPTIGSDYDEGQSSGLERNRDIRKSLTFSGHHGNLNDCSPEIQMENVAIVQPTPQLKSKEIGARKTSQRFAQSPSSPSNIDGSSIYASQKKIREVPPYREPPGPLSPPQQRTLPPYRDPPPPNLGSPGRSQYLPNTSSSPHLHKEVVSSSNSAKSKRNLIQEFQESKSPNQVADQVAGPGQNMVTVAYTQRYVELIRLVNRQRDTINAQQADLTKYDAEILYWETRNREQIHQMDFISQEANRIESTNRAIEEQIKELTHVEEESEIVRQQEKTLKSEITLLRSKLANCETELLQCKNKIRLLAEELAIEQQLINREADDNQMMERKLITEVEHLQNELEQAKRSADMSNQCADSLKNEVVGLEAAIVEKKMQVERLVADMKEANLQSLTVACQDEQVKNLLEGAQKPGSTRKMIGSPRQLETAVPTSKNPHGVWV